MAICYPTLAYETNHETVDHLQIYRAWPSAAIMVTSYLEFVNNVCGKLSTQYQNQVKIKWINKKYIISMYMSVLSTYIQYTIQQIYYTLIYQPLSIYLPKHELTYRGQVDSSGWNGHETWKNPINYYPRWEYKPEAMELHCSKFNPVFSKQVAGEKHLGEEIVIEH